MVGEKTSISYSLPPIVLGEEWECNKTVYSNDFRNYNIPSRKEQEAHETQGENKPCMSEKAET